MKVLLVEDSAALRRSIRVGLDHLGYTVDDTGDGSVGLSMVLSNDYDYLILDLMLPNVDGMSLLRSLRQVGKQTKVIILSAKSASEDRVAGLLAGADDYLTKPFSFDELHARLVSLGRRGQLASAVSSVINLSGFVLDSQKKQFAYQGQLIELTKNEYKIVEYIFCRPNQVFTPEQISEAVVGCFDHLSKNTLEAHLSTIRKKVKQVGAQMPIKNKRGFGYYAGEC